MDLASLIRTVLTFKALTPPHLCIESHTLKLFTNLSLWHSESVLARCFVSKHFWDVQ